MDQFADSVPNIPLFSLETETGNPIPTVDSPPNPSDVGPMPLNPVTGTEQSEPVTDLRPQIPPPPPAVESTEEVEPAYWADFEEDTTVPDDEELKEIDGVDADYSARDRRFPAKTPMRYLITMKKKNR